MKARMLEMRWEEDLLRRNPYSWVTLLSHNIAVASKQKHQGTITQLLRKCVVSSMALRCKTRKAGNGEKSLLNLTA